MHCAQLSFDQRLHLLGGYLRLRECSFLKAVAAILVGTGPIGIRASAHRVPAQRHSATLTGGSFRSEHFSSDHGQSGRATRVRAPLALLRTIARVFPSS
jgi:hypothetical protein